MDELTIRELPQAQTLVLQHGSLDTPLLLRLLADYIEESGATLLSAHYTNDDSDEDFFESLIATVDCPWQL